jgi:hypothetical protein
MSPPSRAYEELNAALVAAGVPARTSRSVKGVSLELEGAVNVLVNAVILPEARSIR